MDLMSIVAYTVFNEGLLQESLNKLIAGLIGAAIAWYFKEWYQNRKGRTNRLDKTYNALFGVDDVDTMEGIVQIIDAHEDDIEELYDRVEKGQERREELAEKLERIKQKISDRHEQDGFEE
jgi:hypothetical protein